MDTTKLIESLSEYGHVEVCKADEVFTLCITGKNLTMMRVVNEVQKKVSDFLQDNYPVVESYRNSKSCLNIILKQKE